MRISNTSERLQKIMKERGLTQKDIIDITGITKSSICMYVSGEREPSQKALYILAKALNVSEVWLMGFDVESAYNEFLDMKVDSKQKKVLDAYLQADEPIRLAIDKLLGI